MLREKFIPTHILEEYLLNALKRHREWCKLGPDECHVYTVIYEGFKKTLELLKEEYR
jgi:hypothetical protein